jgi:hypothetical protein
MVAPAHAGPFNGLFNGQFVQRPVQRPVRPRLWTCRRSNSTRAIAAAAGVERHSAAPTTTFTVTPRHRGTPTQAPKICTADPALKIGTEDRH